MCNFFDEESILKDLSGLIAIKSVKGDCGEVTEKYPLGKAFLCQHSWYGIQKTTAKNSVENERQKLCKSNKSFEPDGILIIFKALTSSNCKLPHRFVTKGS